MDRVCSRCGCASFHYDRSRMRMACDLCGAALSDPQQDQQRMQHDRTCFQAANHLPPATGRKPSPFCGH